MPLFFFASGFCFKDKYLSNFYLFTINKIKGLYIPFLKWSFLFLAFHNIFYYLNLYNDVYGFFGNTINFYYLSDFYNNCKAILIMYGNAQLLGGFWFLRTLFLSSFIFYFVLKCFRNRFLCGGLLLFLAYLFLAFNINTPGVIGIQSKELVASFFMILGYFYAKNDYKYHLKYEFVVAFLIVFFFSSLFLSTSFVDMKCLDKSNLFVYCLAAISGFYIIYFCSYRISLTETKSKELLNFIGSHTFEILTWHFISFKLVSLLVIFIESRPIEQLACFLVIPKDVSDQSFYYTHWFLLYTLVGIGVPMLGVVLKDKINSFIKDRKV